MPDLKLRIHSTPRSAVPADMGVGEALVSQVRRAIAAGRTGLVAVVVRTDTVEQVELGAVREAGVPLPWFLASLTRTHTPSGGPVEAVGILGRAALRPRAGEPAVPVATVFLEWDDNRWWHWQALLDARGTLLPDTERVRLAQAGDPLPPRLGRWWSTGRRQRLVARLDPSDGPIQVH